MTGAAPPTTPPSSAPSRNPDAASVAPPAPRLRAETISFSYDGRNVLSGVSLDASAGEIVGILGPNGSGKTTLIRCLLGLLPPRSGRVLLDGADISELPRREFARKVAAVPQAMPVDFPLRVGELVLLGRLPHLPALGLGFEGPADLAAADAALLACGVADLASRPIHQLSGGELRRVFIARALCQQASVLLLDEPTAGLDLRHQLAILDVLRAQARAGTAIVLVLHDLNLATAICDRMILLRDGSTIAAGRPDEVLTPPILADVYGVTVSVVTAPETGKKHLIPSRLT